jgi:hypothetical protein
MAWREMTERELATLPEGRLGGVLLGMVAAAILLGVITIAGTLLAFQQLVEIGARYVIAVGFVTAWSMVFVAMTLLRIRATPVVTSAGLLAWIAYRFAAAMLGHAGWPVAIDLIGEAISAAGFSAYMSGGMRPNAYFRRRLPTI